MGQPETQIEREEREAREFDERCEAMRASFVPPPVALVCSDMGEAISAFARGVKAVRFNVPQVSGKAKP